MSEEQLSALLAKLKEDAGLREKFQGCADLDAVVALGREAGFDVSQADWLKFQTHRTLELSDEELESVTGGVTPGTVGFVITAIAFTAPVGMAAAISIRDC